MLLCALCFLGDLGAAGDADSKVYVGLQEMQRRRNLSNRSQLALSKSAIQMVQRFKWRRDSNGAAIQMARQQAPRRRSIELVSKLSEERTTGDAVGREKR